MPASLPTIALAVLCLAPSSALQWVPHGAGLPAIHGRVTHDGSAVQASVILRAVDEDELDVEMQPRCRESIGRWESTAADGSFEIHPSRAGTFRLQAWSPELGQGQLATLLEVAPGEELPALELRITEPPGLVAGKVILPPGHRPEELWLAPNTGPGYVRLQSDGSFRLPALPPGPCRVRVVAGYDTPGPRPLSTTSASEPATGYMRLSHGPSRAPGWIPFSPTFPVEVRAGDSAALDSGPGMDPDPPPRVVLYRGNRFDYTARTDIDDQGRFLLGTMTAGEYVLRLELDLADGSSWTVLDRVQLAPGAGNWELSADTGSVRVLPVEREGRHVPFEGKLRWQGPGSVRVFCTRTVELWSDRRNAARSRSARALEP